VTRGQLPQRAVSLGLNGGGAAAVVPPHCKLSVITRISICQVLSAHYDTLLWVPKWSATVQKRQMGVKTYKRKNKIKKLHHSRFYSAWSVI